MSLQKLTFRCPHCNSPVEVEPKAAGELLVCPHPNCAKPFQVELPAGEPVPAPVAVTEGTDVAATAPVVESSEKPPTAIPVAASEAENVIGYVQPVMFRGYPFRFLGYAALVTLGTCGLVLAIIHLSLMMALLSLGVAGFGLFHLGLWWLHTRNTSLTVTGKGCTLRTGIFTTETTDVSLKDLVDVHVNQDMISRFFDVGDVVLTSGGDKKRQLVMKAIPAPQKIVSQIHP